MRHLLTGFKQMQQTLTKHTQIQQTLIEHMQMQLGMNEKTQAFQDQQVINLTGVKSQLDAMVSKPPISEEAVTSLKQAAQYLHKIGKKLGKLQDDPEITRIPLDPQDSRADFVESDGPCGTLERFWRAVDVPEALDGTGYVTSTPAHETQFRNFGESRRDDLTLDESNCSGFSISSASWPERESGSSQTQGGHGADELRQSENERRLVRQLIPLDDATTNRAFLHAPSPEETRFIVDFRPSLEVTRTSRSRPQSRHRFNHPTITRIQGARFPKRRLPGTSVSNRHLHSAWRTADMEGMWIPEIVNLCGGKDEKHAIGPAHVQEAVWNLQICESISPDGNSSIPITMRGTEPVVVHSATSLDHRKQPISCVREQSLATAADYGCGGPITSDSLGTAKPSDGDSTSVRASPTPNQARMQRIVEIQEENLVKVQESVAEVSHHVPIDNIQTRRSMLEGGSPLESTDTASTSERLQGQPSVASGEVDPLLNSSSDDTSQTALMSIGKTIVSLEDRGINSSNAQHMDAIQCREREQKSEKKSDEPYLESRETGLKKAAESELSFHMGNIMSQGSSHLEDHQSTQETELTRRLPRGSHKNHVSAKDRRKRKEEKLKGIGEVHRNKRRDRSKRNRQGPPHLDATKTPLSGTHHAHLELSRDDSGDCRFGDTTNAIAQGFSGVSDTEAVSQHGSQERSNFTTHKTADPVIPPLQSPLLRPGSGKGVHLGNTDGPVTKTELLARIPPRLSVSSINTMITDTDPTSDSTTDGQDGVGTSYHTKQRCSTLQDSIAEPERQIESSENHLVQSDTPSPAAHCGQTATGFPAQRPASHPQASTHRRNIAQSPSKTYQGFQMSATEVPTKERSPEELSSLPPERRCGEKRPREEDTVGHQGIKMKAPRLTVPLERTGDDHNQDLSYGEDEGIASVADIQMADSPTSDDQPSGPQEDHASEPDYDTDNAANLNESDLESVKSDWRSRVQGYKVAKQMDRYIIDNARKEVRSELRHPETRFNGRYEDGSTFILSDGASQYPSREEISASAFLPSLTAQDSASLEVAKQSGTMEQLHDQENPRQLSMSPRTTSREGHKAGNHTDRDSRNLESVSRGQVTPEKLNEETGTRPMHPSHMSNIISRTSMYGRSAQPIESVGQDSMILPTGGDIEEADIAVPLHLIERSLSPVSQVGHNLQVHNLTQPQNFLVNSQHDGRTSSGMDGDRLSRDTEDNGLKQGVQSLVDSDDVELIKETRLPDARSVEDEHIFVAPARDDELSGTTFSLAPSSSQRIVSPDSILPDVSIQSSTVLPAGKICAAHDHQQQALDAEPSSTRQNHFPTDPIESGEQAEQGTVPDPESNVEFASIDSFCQTRSEMEL